MMATSAPSLSLELELELLIGLSVEHFSCEMGATYQSVSGSISKWVVREENSSIYKSIEIYPVHGKDEICLLIQPSITVCSCPPILASDVVLKSNKLVTIPLMYISPPYHTTRILIGARTRIYMGLYKAWEAVQIRAGTLPCIK